MFGEIEFEKFEGLTHMPQKAASAWAAVDTGLVGASYKPLLYVGSQPVKGVNHWFIAEQTLITATPETKIVTIAVNEFNGAYCIIPTSVNTVSFDL